MEGIILPGEEINFETTTRVNYRKDICKTKGENTFIFRNSSKVEEIQSNDIQEEGQEQREVRIKFMGEIYVPRTEDVIIGTVVRRFASISYF